MIMLESNEKIISWCVPVSAASQTASIPVTIFFILIALVSSCMAFFSMPAMAYLTMSQTILQRSCVKVAL
jgi:hypothetical protein